MRKENKTKYFKTITAWTFEDPGLMRIQVPRGPRPLENSISLRTVDPREILAVSLHRLKNADLLYINVIVKLVKICNIYTI